MPTDTQSLVSRLRDWAGECLTPEGRDDLTEAADALSSQAKALEEIDGEAYLGLLEGGRPPLDALREIQAMARAAPRHHHTRGGEVDG